MIDRELVLTKIGAQALYILLNAEQTHIFRRAERLFAFVIRVSSLKLTSACPTLFEYITLIFEKFIMSTLSTKEAASFCVQPSLTECPGICPIPSKSHEAD